VVSSDGASASAECSVTIVARLPEITVPFFGQYALAAGTFEAFRKTTKRAVFLSEERVVS